MGGCSVGSMLTYVIWSLQFSPAPFLLVLYTRLMPCTGFLFFITISIRIMNWIDSGCDGWKEEEENLKKKDEGELTTV
jgi:hypothetical protein